MVLMVLILGFLDQDDLDEEQGYGGLMGLYDQYFALKWIQEYFVYLR